METVVIVIHLMVIVAMVALVLLQRSEGGALGIGGGGGFMSSRGQGNVLTRSTAILAAAFFATSITLTIIARLNEPASSILDDVPAAESTVPAAPNTSGSGQGILDTLQGMSQPGQGTDSAPATDDGTSIPTTPIVPATPAEPQVPTSQ
jgi:preprotein translocase subunit SecG